MLGAAWNSISSPMLLELSYRGELAKATALSRSLVLYSMPSGISYLHGLVSIDEIRDYDCSTYCSGLGSSSSSWWNWTSLQGVPLGVTASKSLS